MKYTQKSPKRLTVGAHCGRHNPFFFQIKDEGKRKYLCTSPDDVRSLIGKQIQFADRELFLVITLDARKRVIKTNPISVGGLTESCVHPREVFKCALLDSAQAIILAHNHPSGDPTPSAEDIKITRTMVGAGETLSIPVLDHVVVGRKRDDEHCDYMSIRESGLVKFEN